MSASREAGGTPRARLIGLAKRAVGAALHASPPLRRAAVAAIRTARDRTLDYHVWRNTKDGDHALPFDPFKIVRIDPRHVVHAVGDEGVAMYTWKKVGAVEPGDWDRDTTVFEERRTFRGLRRRLVDGAPWSETDVYRDNVALIAEGHVKWGCRTIEAFERRLRHLEALHDEIRTHGYKTQRELADEGRRRDPMGHLDFFSDRQRALDEIVISIARDGELLFVNQGSQHRLALAKILGLRDVPARVLVRHAEWQRLRDDLARHLRAVRDGRTTYRLPHPDLGEVPYRHDPRGWVEALAGRSSLGSLLEVGGGLAAPFAHAVADEGIPATALEGDPARRALLERLASWRPDRVEVSAPSPLLAGDRPFDVVVVHLSVLEDAFLPRPADLARLARRALFVFDPDGAPGTRTALDAALRGAGFADLVEVPAPGATLGGRMLRAERS